MEDIIVKQAAGVTLRLTRPFGAGGVYHIYLNNLYQGQVVYQQGQHAVHLNPNSRLTDRHKAMILEAINQI